MGKYTETDDRRAREGTLRDVMTAVETLAATNGRAPTIASRANATAAASPNANGTPLAAESTPYIRASVMAVKGGANAYTPGVANTGTVYIATADSLAAAIALAPGASMELPPNCDLADFYLIVANAADAVQITYTA